MKKVIVITLILLFGTTLVKSQPFNVQSAYNFMNKGKLDKAKTAIDEATLDGKTSTWPKTWYYRGSIYYDIYFSKDKNFKSLDTNALKVSFDAFLKAIQLDEKKEFFNDYHPKILSCEAQYYYNKGIQSYNLGVKNNDKKSFKDALSNFELTIATSAQLGITDTSSLFNAAISAEKSGKYDISQSYYAKLIKLQPKKIVYYLNLQKVFKMNKDTAKALETINKGLELFPENLTLIIEQTNIYLAKGQTEKAQQNLYKAIEKDPKNFNLYYAIGNNYDKIYYDTVKTMPERLAAYQQSEEVYKKAIELKPDFFDANYNLGALYFNEGVRLKEVADKIQDQKKYEEENSKVDPLMQKALPFLEKAILLLPNDKNTLISLKSIYARTKQYDKAKEINLKLEQLNAAKQIKK